MLKGLICILTFLFSLHGQNVHIIDVLDANLFKMADSSLISMVNLEAPSLKDPDTNRVELAKKAVRLAKLNMLKQKLRFEASYKNTCSDDQVQSGHLFRVYPLGDKNLNELYLEKGYAIYVPCDTLYMDLYREAGLESMNDKLGLWMPVKRAARVNFFNRFRLSLWLYQGFLEENAVPLLPPLFGLNYRWSDVVTLVEDNKTHLNFSIETGTLLYFVLPYANFGLEARLSNFYLRGHYDSLIPFFMFFDKNDLEFFDFWGFDIGIIIPFGGKGLEIEYNIKTKDGFYINYFTVSFAVY